MTEKKHPSGAVEAVIQLAAADPEFRQALMEDPETALRERDLQVSAEDMQLLAGMSTEEREQLAEQLDARQSASGFGHMPKVGEPGT